MNSSDEWELSKENVQPLKHGRKVTSLTAALQPHNVDQHQQLILQRQSMEATLRSYAGEDPLEPWDEYIKWTEQAYPNGGKDSNLQVLLEKCVAKFKKEARYNNDVRYVSCWIKLANGFLNNPLEIFQFMRDQAIGTGLSVFYEAWSWELEQHGNTMKADAVYREGLACHAHPKDRLEVAHREFQSRIARATMSQIQDGVDASGSQTDQRDHLGELRARGRQQKVSSQRVGPAKQASKGGLGTTLPTPQVGQSFSVFCDSEPSSRAPSGVCPSSLPAPTGEWECIPVRQESQKENMQGAGPWAGQKVRQHRSAGIGISEAATFAEPSFKVHVDVSGPEMTQRKMPEIGSQVLSARKPEKPSNLLQNMAQLPVDDDKTKAMYCKHLIYNGANEMSFEELRGIKYNAKREAKKIEEERLALEKQRAEYQAMVRQQQEAMEHQLLQQRLLHQQQLEEQKVAQQQMQQQLQQQMQQQMQEQLQQQMQQQMQQQQQQMHQQLQHMQQQIHRQPLMAPKQQRPAQVQLSTPLQHGVALSAGQETKPDIALRDPTVTRHLIYEETGNQAMLMGTSYNSTPHHPPPSTTGTGPINSHLGTSQITPGSTTTATAAAAPNVSQSRTPNKHSAPTPVSFHSRNSSCLSLSRMTPGHTPGGLARPSPTVHTKEAMSVVMAMLNNPLGDDDDFMLGSGQQLAPARRDNDFEAMFGNTESQPRSFPEFKNTSDVSAFSTIGKGASVGPSFTIFNESEALDTVGAVGGLDKDEYEHLDNQENMPPRHYVKPNPDGRPRFGILQPAQGIPFMSLEEQENAAREEQSLQEMDAVDGVEPLPIDDNIQRPDMMNHHAINETVLNHPDAHSAFKAASRMASTPFTSSGVLSFPPLSSIKPSLLGVDIEDSANQLPDPSGDGSRGASGRPVPLGSRVMEANSLGSFEATECTMNADNQQPLSPIMERSNEDARSSTSSSTNSTGSSHHCSTTHAGASLTSNAGLSVTHAALSTSFGGRSTYNISSSTTRNGLSSTHAGVSTSRAGLSATCERVAVTPQAPSSSSKGPSSSSFFPTHAGSVNTSNVLLTTTQRSLSTTSASLSITTHPSLNATSQVIPPPASLSSTGLDILDASNVSMRRGLSNHLNQIESQSSHHARSRQMNGLFDGSNLDINREADPGLGVDHHKGPTSEVLGKNKPQSFRIVDDSTGRKPSGMPTSSGSFQVFEDEPKQIGSESGGAFSLSFHDAPSQDNNFSQKVTSQEDTRSLREKPSHEGFNMGAFEKSSSPQSFKIFDESAYISKSLTDPAPMQLFQSSDKEDFRIPTSSTSLNQKHQRLQQQESHESMTREMNPPDASLHLSTLLMSKMHIAETEDAVMEMSLHHNTSLMDHSGVPDDAKDGHEASNVGEDIINPFSDVVTALLLENIPLCSYNGYAECDYPMPELVLSEAVGLGDEWYTIEKLSGEGAFAKVYQASILSLHTGDHSKLLRGENDKVALKVQKPACPWEFYISRVLHERLDAFRNPVDVRASVMYANDMHVFPDSSCLVTKHHLNLTLLDAVNAYNKSKSVMPEPLLLLFTIEILHIVEQMHACGIIHGDIKPDNFLLLLPDDDEDSDENASSAIMTNTKHVKLIDFGRSIDMQLFLTGTTFTAKCDTDSFMCPEMLKGRPWTYQTDLFGVAGTVHCLMFGSYMKVYKEKEHWKHTSNIKRFYAAKWKQFFDTLLNIPSCDALPSLGELRRDLEEALAKMHTNLDAKMKKLVTMVSFK